MATVLELPETVRGPVERAGLHWLNLWFIATAHLVAAFAIVYMAAIHFSWWTVGLALVWTAMSGVSVTGGYHRLFSHRAYQASWIVRAFYLLFGAAAVQNSALTWCSDHRAHHAHTDKDGDPYNIRKGFWWAHIVWVVTRTPEHGSRPPVTDLANDPLVQWQHKYYIPLAIVVGALIPMAIGAAWGDAIGALLVVGWLRVIVQWHATFSVNSLAHTFGSQPYSDRGTARDSFLVALITLGEGYHNFHHRFQADYRNGVRWYHFDPTKWFVWTLERVGLVKDLRRVSMERIRAARRSQPVSSP